MPSNSKFTKNDNGDTSVRVVSSAQSVVDTNQDSVFCKDEGGNVAIRVVTAQESLPAEQPDSMFTKDTNGNTAIRTVGGGSAPVINELNVTPTTSAQTITAPEGTDGYSPVNVSAVTSAIDANIAAGNIKKDVSILGVTGSYEGVAPSGTKSITTNGTHDVAGYANADVQVPTTAPAHYIEKTVNANGKLINGGASIIDLTGVTDVSDYVLARAYSNTGISGAVDMSNLTTVSGSNACASMFFLCAGITSVDLSSLTTVSGSSACASMFQGCTGITSVDLSSLTTVSGSSACGMMFQSCTRITSVDLSSLTTVSGSSACANMFQGCTSLATVYVGGTTAINFGTNTNQFANIFKSCTQNIDVYAPAANQTQIEAFSGYPKFGATGTVTWHWRS